MDAILLLRILRSIEVLLAVWVYYDATGYKIGKLSRADDIKSRSANPVKYTDNLSYIWNAIILRFFIGLNMTAGAWAFGILLLGIAGSLSADIGGLYKNFLMMGVPVACYFACRQTLIQRAVAFPVEIPALQRNVSLLIFLSIALFVLYISWRETL